MAECPDAVADAVAAVLAPLGLELFDAELIGAGRGRTLRVYIDRDGGVDLDAITAASEAISPVLDHDPAAARALAGPYALEVSSPGVERPLRTPAHFRRALSSTVSVKTRDAEGRGERRRGVLVHADEPTAEGAGIDLLVDDEPVHVAYPEIVQARTVFEWGPAPKPSKGNKARNRARQHAAERSDR